MYYLLATNRLFGMVTHINKLPAKPDLRLFDNAHNHHLVGELYSATSRFT